MSPELLTLLGLTLVLAGLVGVLIFAIVRMGRGRAQQAARRRQRLSEEAFMATAIQQVREERGMPPATTPLAGAQAVSSAPGADPGPARGPIDTAIVDALPVALMVVDESGLLRRFNGELSTLLGVKPMGPLPAPLRHVLGAHPALVQSIDAARRTQVPSTTRIDLPWDDDWRTIEVAWSPLPPGAEGKRIVVSLRDVTKVERQQAVIRRQETMVQVAQLASSLAHELANSLTAVHGYARMIDARGLAAADRAALESVQKETDTLNANIDTFRRITRPLEITQDVFPLRWLVDDAARHAARECHVDPDVIGRRVPESLQIEGDRVLLEEALIALLINAIEACASAGVAPAATVTAVRSVDSTEVQVIVEDNGPGVSEGDRDHLFLPFFSTKAGRAGVGLARARHIVHSHDGAVSASHPSVGGLRITVTLPLSATARSTAAPQ